MRSESSIKSWDSNSLVHIEEYKLPRNDRNGGDGFRILNMNSDPGYECVDEY